MKKIFAILSILFIGLFFTACEDLLDVEPFQQVSDTQAITDASSARAALLGAYSQVQDYYRLNYPVLGYLPAENVRFNGTLNQFLQIDQNALTPDNVIVTGTWSQIYAAILSANNVIAALPDITDVALSQAERNQLTGEAYFIRALGYFDLGRAWGGVPLVLKPTRSVADGKGIGRSTLAQTYDQVLTDLTEAEKLLPEATTRNRAVKNAARALRARLHLYRQQWAEAETYATQVITNTNYRLVTPYKAFFTAPFLTQESIFELTYSNADQNSHWNNWYPSALGGQYTLQPSPSFIENVNKPDIGGGRKDLIASVVNGGTTFVYGNLYNRAAQRDDPYYVLRIAEQYLIRAEARTRQNKLTEALGDLNAVRTRAGLTQLSLTTAEAILLAIENERRFEFAFEADRWFDLARTGRIGAVLGITDQRKWILPIPLREVSADPDLEQNPGY